MTDSHALRQLNELKEVERTVEGATAPPTEISSLVMTKLSEVRSSPISWLWKGMMARGKLTLVAGHPGLGKSQVALGFAATVSAGHCWPASGDKATVSDVLILSAEDDIADTIRPRLEAAGADLEKIHVLEAVRCGPIRRRSFNFETDLHELGKVLCTYPSIRFLVIDPISAYLGRIDSNSNSEVRGVFAELSALASKFDVAMLAISHLNKGSSPDAITRISGSMAFVAASRAAYLVAKDGEDKQLRHFAPMKNNIGPDQGTYSYKIETVTLPTKIETSRIVWADLVRKGITANDLIEIQNQGGSKNKLGTAMEFLSELLAAGPKSQKEIEKVSAEHGISMPTMQRAKKELGISSVKMGMDGGWMWSLFPEGDQICVT